MEQLTTPKDVSEDDQEVVNPYYDGASPAEAIELPSNRINSGSGYSEGLLAELRLKELAMIEKEKELERYKIEKEMSIEKARRDMEDKYREIEEKNRYFEKLE